LLQVRGVVLNVSSLDSKFKAKNISVSEIVKLFRWCPVGEVVATFLDCFSSENKNYQE
jgi:hypothetical protein